MNDDLLARLRGKANDADCWADSYEGQRQEAWLREHARVERDAAAEVERLRALLERVQEYLHNPFEPDNQSALYKDVSAALASVQ
jgi:hypothetical protein